MEVEVWLSKARRETTSFIKKRKEEASSAGRLTWIGSRPRFPRKMLVDKPVSNRYMPWLQ